ncbi:Ewing'S Tumor-Associated Antigen 1 [Manis pentadactyla]|nr:Ewing'S Tumor-Associated Antigen 1 [Manis pentadactyla]
MQLGLSWNSFPKTNSPPEHQFRTDEELVVNILGQTTQRFLCQSLQKPEATKHSSPGKGMAWSPLSAQAYLPATCRPGCASLTALPQKNVDVGTRHAVDGDDREKLDEPVALEP